MDIESIIKMLSSIILALFGGFVRSIRAVKDKKVEGNYWLFFLAEIATSAFAGMICYFLLVDLDMPESIKFVGTSISGYAAPELLSIIRMKFLDKIKKN